MDVQFIVTLSVVILLFLAVGCVIVCVLYREKKIQQVRRMGTPQKVRQLNELAKPFGFLYEPEEDIFTTQLDAWQRGQGYEALFDHAAVGMNMVIDAWPVYFDYDGRTWLIEFWKGQYGINTGGEVGIYHAKEIIPPHLYTRAHYDAIEDEEIPIIESRLMKNEAEVFSYYGRHWWLTGFRMGMFSKPSELCLLASITFREPEMVWAFLGGLKRSGQPSAKYQLCGNSVCVKMDFSRAQTLPARVHRFLVQRLNRCLCALYRMVTCPFENTVDRMMFLYYLMPWCFRRMLKIGGKRWNGVR